MRGLSNEGERIVEDVARRHAVSQEAVTTLLTALSRGNGTMAQFNHPDLGGMGQWSRGGMIMVGDMFNHELRHRVDALCTELSDLLRNSSLFVEMSAVTENGQPAPDRGSTSQWPAELGSPSSSGSQNDLHYAVFPDQHRLAIEDGGKLAVYDTADHVITGFSQQQSGDQSLSFMSQHGLVRIADLALVANSANPNGAAAPEPDLAGERPPAEGAGNDAPRVIQGDDDVFAKIERLSDLRRKDIITEAEFQNKKAELLARL